MDKKEKLRIKFIIVAVLLIAVEFIIGLFVHDKFIRPYFGDVLVVIILYAFVRIVIPLSKKNIAIYVFIFSALYEFTQKIPLVDLLGINNNFMRVLMGTSFAWLDIVCYFAGCIFCLGHDIKAKKSC